VAESISEHRRVDIAELIQEGQRLWRVLPPGAVVWLSGELGTGKTTLVQAVLAAAGGERARSPTFALVHEYQSPHGLIAHVDCYRLRSPKEAHDLDLCGLAQRARLTLIEWPERAGAFAPPADRRLLLSHSDRMDQRIIGELS